MNSEAAKFATYLKNNNVDSFNVEELAYEHMNRSILCGQRKKPPKSREN